jgi:hypothetical protein
MRSFGNERKHENFNLHPQLYTKVVMLNSFQHLSCIIDPEINSG